MRWWFAALIVATSTIAYLIEGEVGLVRHVCAAAIAYALIDLAVSSRKSAGGGGAVPRSKRTGRTT